MSPLLVVLGLTLTEPAKIVLQHFSLAATEQVGCLMGEVRGDTLDVRWVRPLAARGTQTVAVVDEADCPPDALGRVHSHPGGERCWYTFPGTSVPSSDGVVARRGKFRVDAIVCGGILVWTDASLAERRLQL